MKHICYCAMIEKALEAINTSMTLSVYAVDLGLRGMLDRIYVTFLEVIAQTKTLITGE